MDDLKSQMYRVYKSQRDFIKMTRHKKMDYDEFLFLQRVHQHCDEIDSANSEFLDRWIKELEDDA
jgi:hypothetical protein